MIFTERYGEAREASAEAREAAHKLEIAQTALHRISDLVAENGGTLTRAAILSRLDDIISDADEQIDAVRPFR